MRALPRLVRAGRRRGAGARRRVMGLLREIPRFVRLLLRLVGDPRVSAADKAFLGIVVAYVLAPFDLIPDFLVSLGLFDDLFLLGLALNRLLANAGPRVLRDHWDGNMRTLRALLDGLGDVGSVLPRGVRRALRETARA